MGIASVDAVAAELGNDVAAERFRANVVLQAPRAFDEDALVSRRVRLGGAVLELLMTSPRCVMVDAETDDLPAQPGVLAAVGRVHGAHLGVVARVVEPGTVRVGDELAPLG